MSLDEQPKTVRRFDCCGVEDVTIDEALACLSGHGEGYLGFLAHGAGRSGCAFYSTHERLREVEAYFGPTTNRKQP